MSIVITGDEKSRKFVLEGWACVDNISEDEWENVSLSLVSGSPISFQHDVYNPIIGIRPTQFSDEGYVRCVAFSTIPTYYKLEKARKGYNKYKRIDKSPIACLATWWLT